MKDPDIRDISIMDALPVGHCNYWLDLQSRRFRWVDEFRVMAKPYHTTISKIRTKPRDKELGNFDYLIVVDKRQRWQ